ncbi:MAG: class I SAM-dependent methyltransferase [Deltaproteobacteria bacterium]|nr:class I SAM-dependent methyltransferase [Deltaproteobacteria bacterium]
MLSQSSAERRYDRIAWVFDSMELPMEMIAAKKWRKNLLSQLEGHHILEVGVGTGKNLTYYPPGKSVTAIDISERMLSRAREKAGRLGFPFRLLKMDVEALPFPDSSYDAAVSTFVFCSVPDPVKGLRELVRVLKPKGKAYLWEHVRPRGFRGYSELHRDEESSSLNVALRILFKIHIFSFRNTGITVFLYKVLLNKIY